jgi:hypothetical protein
MAAGGRDDPGSSFPPLAEWPLEIVEVVVARLLPAGPSPFDLPSDHLACTLGAALANKALFDLVAERCWAARLVPPSAPLREGPRLTAEQVRRADAEQLRAWAAEAGVARVPKRRRRWEQPEQQTHARLRQLVADACVMRVPPWVRQLFRGARAHLGRLPQARMCAMRGHAACYRGGTLR